MKFTDAILQARIIGAKEKSLQWLDSMQVLGLPDGVLRVSALHDVERWPQMLLSGTRDGGMARALLAKQPADKVALASWILTCQGEDGYFLLLGLDWTDTYKRQKLQETKQYMRFHITNYCMGMLEALDQLDRFNMPFLKPFLDEQYLWAWLGQRDMRDPWLEGNNIVNLGSFLLVEHQRNPQGPALKRRYFRD